MSRTNDRPGGRSDLSMRVQLPLALWLSISSRSAAVQPAASSAVTCLRVRGSADTEKAANAQPWPRTPSDAASCGRWRRVTRSQSIRSEGISAQASLEVAMRPWRIDHRVEAFVSRRPQRLSDPCRLEDRRR
eukprot:6178966-Pleurochrysis_carterae.AAC.1